MNEDHGRSGPSILGPDFWSVSYNRWLWNEMPEETLLRGINITLPLQVGDIVVDPKPEIKYLGIMIDYRLSFGAQIQQSANKAPEGVNSLSRLMTNVTWPKAIQSRAALRIASAYRTASEPAILVIAGVIPIAPLAKELKAVHLRKTEVVTTAPSKEERKKTIQVLADGFRVLGTQLKRKLDRDIDQRRNTWTGRLHGDTNYYLTQFQSGHGYFRAYLYKMGRGKRHKCV
ncbi:uncharacterized protein LOC124431019 [Vespa crabro]|uniref:uncharacterized protein LOC124431019 n=1 Tax=Vespa crabro TaxID=7445 RepID=UPI001EFF6953|nr:uncharacterized protein LOC124431019 [Vespa crabro]